MKKRKWQGIISGGLALGLFFSLQPVSAQTLVKEETGQVGFGTVSEHFGLDAGISRTEKRQLRLGRDFYLPVWYGKIQREEIQVSERPYTKAEAEAEAELEKWAAEEKLLEKGVHIIGNNVKIQENGFSFSIEGEILCEEQIAVFRQISEPEDEEEKSSMETGES